jgi:2,3-bisphosphoglycerate-dependent phosphoglycerate mutase
MSDQMISDTSVRDVGVSEGQKQPLRTVYLVRHCHATGGGSDTALSEEGERQALALLEWFRVRGVPVRRIISSPLLRAVQSVTPLAHWADVPIEADERLRERVLSGTPLPDWREPTIASFADPDLCLEGGESGRQAADRASAVLEAALTLAQAAEATTEGQSSSEGAIVLVTHGQPLTQLLGRFDPAFGFDAWLAMTNPDIYRLRFTPGTLPRPERVWQT